MHSTLLLETKRCCAFKLSDWVLDSSLVCYVIRNWNDDTVAVTVKISICVNRYRIKIYFHDIRTYPKLTLTNPKEMKQKKHWFCCNILSISGKSWMFLNWTGLFVLSWNIFYLVLYCFISDHLFIWRILRFKLFNVAHIFPF